MEELTDEQSQAWRAFLAARAHVTQRVETELAAVGDLTLGELDVLFHLEENGGTMRMSLLADRVHASRSGLTRRVDRMIKQGLVARRSAPEDKRGSYAVITEAGQLAYAEAIPHHSRSLRDHVFGDLTDEELSTLTAILKKLAGTSLLQDASSLT